MWRHQPPSGIPVYVRPVGTPKWRRGHAAWANDVFTFRAAAILTGGRARHEERFRVASAQERTPTSEERWWIHRLGGDMVVGRLRLRDGGAVDVASRRSYGPALFGDGALHQAA